MKLFTDHRYHLAIVVGSVVAAAIFGWGAGVVAAAAILGCFTMFGVLWWLVASDSRGRSNDQDYEHR